jgi:hypothetical protein
MEEFLEKRYKREKKGKRNKNKCDRMIEKRN